MIWFDLGLAHPEYRGPITAILSDLLGRYPRAALRRVVVGEPRRDGDVSLGRYDPDAAEIRLNSHWFGRPMSVLREAASTPPLFHGDGAMLDEPHRLLAHEFFHSLSWASPSLSKWAKSAWLEATIDPKIAPSQYGLANPEEYLAEACAANHLGFDFPQRVGLIDVLRSLE